MNFTDKQMQVKWKSKRQSCNKRNIPILLTKEQFFFLYQHNNLVCDYTGLGMSTDHTKDNFISLERIDPLKPYELGNICFITKAANHIKGTMFDQQAHGNQEAGVKLSGKYREVFFQLVDVVRNHEYIQMIKDKYSKENVGKMMNSKSITQEIEEDKTTAKGNPEILIARLYAGLGDYIQDRCDSQFELTYPQFKQTLVQRKNCQLTGRKLPEDISERRLWVVDKTKPVSKGNVLVCDKTLCEALDVLVVSAKLSFKDLQKIAKVLGK